MPSSHYETSNVYLASFLLYLGAVFIGFERVSKRRFLFRFRADEKLHEILRLYWRNTEVPLIPARLFGRLRRLKGLVRGSPVTSAQPLPPTSHAEL
jgi:hypothetical protein